MTARRFKARFAGSSASDPKHETQGR
jgi:hypothetical protein